MKNRSLKMFFKHLRNNKVIELYEKCFDKVFDFNLLLDISEEEIYKIISYNRIESVIRIYELINKITIDDKIKKYILSLDDIELIKYSLRLAISNSFNDDDIKLNYIIAVSQSTNKESIKYACAVANCNAVNNNEHGIEYVRMTGNSVENISVLIRDLVLDKDFLQKEDSFEFITELSKAQKEYIGEYMVNLYGKVSVKKISILLYSKGIKQAECTHRILSNTKVMGREDGNLIALYTASRDEGYEAERCIQAILNDDIMNRKNTFDRIVEFVSKDSIEEKEGIECNFEEVLESRNLDKIIRSLATVPENISIDKNTKVKVLK